MVVVSHPDNMDVDELELKLLMRGYIAAKLTSRESWRGFRHDKMTVRIKFSIGRAIPFQGCAKARWLAHSPNSLSALASSAPLGLLAVICRHNYFVLTPWAGPALMDTSNFG